MDADKLASLRAKFAARFAESEAKRIELMKNWTPPRYDEDYFVAMEWIKKYG